MTTAAYAATGKIRNKRCCPAFIVAGAALGAIIADKYIVQRPTNLECVGIGRVFEEEYLYRVAQLFELLIGALREVDGFYGELGKRDLRLVHGKPYPRFYPHCTTFIGYASKVIEELEYVRPLTHSVKSPFLARLKSSGEMAVVRVRAFTNFSPRLE